MMPIEKALSGDAKMVYELQRKVEDKRRKEAEQAKQDILAAIKSNTIDTTGIEKQLEKLVEASTGQPTAIDASLKEVLKAIKAQKIEVTVPPVEVPPIDVPEPKVTVVETEKVIEKETVRDSVKVSNLDELSGVIEKLIEANKEGKVTTELSAIIGKTARKDAIPVNVVDGIVGGGGGVVPFVDDSGEMGKHALVDSAGHQQVDVLTVQDAVPTDSTKNNPSSSITYDDSDQPTTIDMTIGATTYRRTLTWTDGKMTGISAWAVV